MYAHQVMDYLANIDMLKINGVSREFGNHILRAKKNLQNAIKINFPGANDLRDKFMPSCEGQKLFNSDISIYARLPFAFCWFDYLANTESQPLPGKVRVSKRGLLCENISNNGGNVFFVTLFNFFNDFNTWAMGLVAYICVPGGIKKNKEAMKSCGNFFNIEKVDLESEATTLSTPLLDGLSKKELDTIVYEDRYDLVSLEFGLALLNCKNIETKKIYPDKKLNNSRIKKKKHPLFTYHTLVVSQKKKSYQNDVSMNKCHNGLHFCRGHFKEYTTDNPLFGKYTGLYWWQPHIRGDKKLGIVHKDYEVRN